MDIMDFLRSLPLTVTFLVMLFTIIISIYLGYLLGCKILKRISHTPKTAVSTVVTATMALLAFMLGFTFNVTSQRLDTRRMLMLEEVNAIHTTYLRTVLIPEEMREPIRSLLREYVDLRVKLTKNAKLLVPSVKRAEQIQDEIWSYVLQINNRKLDNPEVTALFIDAVNKMFDLQTKRIALALVFKLPGLFWLILMVLTFLSMAEVGYLFGLSGKKPNILLILFFGLSFSTVITLITDLDRGSPKREGVVKVPSILMENLQKKISQ